MFLFFGMKKVWWFNISGKTAQQFYFARLPLNNKKIKIRPHKTWKKAERHLKGMKTDPGLRWVWFSSCPLISQSAFFRHSLTVWPVPVLSHSVLMRQKYLLYQGVTFLKSLLLESTPFWSAPYVCMSTPTFWLRCSHGSLHRAMWCYVLQRGDGEACPQMSGHLNLGPVPRQAVNLQLYGQKLSTSLSSAPISRQQPHNENLYKP